MLYTMYLNMSAQYCLFNDKKSLQKVRSKDLVHEKAFWLSSCKPHAFKILKSYYT